jgi:hypothetical protein
MTTVSHGTASAPTHVPNLKYLLASGVAAQEKYRPVPKLKRRSERVWAAGIYAKIWVQELTPV